MDLILYIAFAAALLISFVAQIKVSTTFNKYSRIPSRAGKTAAEVASMILRENGINDVRIEMVGGNLTDHFDPRSRVLRLSESVYSSTSSAAVGVAAHEAGHAIQHAVGYFPIKLRGTLVPITNISSRISWIVIALGLVISAFAELGNAGYYVILFGVGLFSMTAVFQLVTLPCEFDASRRALANLERCGWYSQDELSSSRKVLSAAAMTYVAALFVSIIQVLRLLLIFTRGRKR